MYFLFLLPYLVPPVLSVTQLTVDTFEGAIRKYDNVLVFFYSPLCNECDRFEKKFEKLDGEFKNEIDILLGKVDIRESELAEIYEVRYTLHLIIVSDIFVTVS